MTRFPRPDWLSEHKNGVFAAAGIALLIAGALQWNARNLPCPLDPAEARACSSARRASWIAYLASVVIYLLGVGFAFGPLLLGSPP